MTTGWGSGPPHLLHLTGGRFMPVHMLRRDGRYVGVFGLADVPGSRSVWGVGALTSLDGRGPATGLILKYGR